MNLKKILILFLVTTTIFACKKDDDDNSKSAAQFSFTVLLNGRQFTASTVTAEVNSGYIAIKATNATGENVYLLTNGAKVGNFPIDSSSSNYVQYQQSKNSSLYSSALLDDPVGQINIISIDNNAHTISGTFSGEAGDIDSPDSISFVAGTFSNIPFEFNAAAVNLGFIKFEVNGIPISMGTGSVQRVSGGGNSEDVINISSATSGFGEAISIVMEERYLKVGTFLIGDPFLGYRVRATYNEGSGFNSTTYEAINGVLDIKEINNSTKLVRGTFEFNAESFFDPADIKQIKKGSFEAYFR